MVAMMRLSGGVHRWINAAASLTKAVVTNAERLITEPLRWWEEGLRVVERGCAQSRRCVKCQDHAWKMLCKHKGPPRLQKIV